MCHSQPLFKFWRIILNSSHSLPSPNLQNALLQGSVCQLRYHTMSSAPKQGRGRGWGRREGVGPAFTGSGWFVRRRSRILTSAGLEQCVISVARKASYMRSPISPSWSITYLQNSKCAPTLHCLLGMEGKDALSAHSPKRKQGLQNP